MIAIEVDFNHADGRGRLLLADLAAHERTPFADLAESDKRILFVDGDEYVEGRGEVTGQPGDWHSLDSGPYHCLEYGHVAHQSR